MKPRHPSGEGLRDLVHDTPSKPMSALDDRLARFNADLDSIPPPPPNIAQQRDSFVESRGITRSGSWDLERLLGAQQGYYERALSVAIAAERNAHLQERAEAAEGELDHRKKRRDKIVDTVIATVGAAIVLGGLGLLLKLVILVK